MRISVIIPCFNHAQYLPEAIESVLDQSRKADEIVVISDGSTDNSLEIANKYPVKVINQVNKGLPSARNTGIMNATGDYIFPLDADDILLPECLEKIEQAAEENNYPDVIAPSFKQFGVSNYDFIFNGIPSLSEFKTANRLPYFCAIKREVLLEVGGYNPKMKLGYEDYDLWFDIFKRKHSLCLIQEKLVLYRTKENSMLTESNKHKDELMAQIRTNHPELWS